MITLDQAKQLRNGTTLYSMFRFNSKGYPDQWRVTSVKTWKTRPQEVEIGLKYGLYSYDRINQNDLELVTLDPNEPRIEWIGRQLVEKYAEEARTADKRQRSTLRRQITRLEEERQRLIAESSPMEESADHA